jgi:hypothetical protein
LRAVAAVASIGCEGKIASEAKPIRREGACRMTLSPASKNPYNF